VYQKSATTCGGHLRKRRPLKIQRKNSGSGNKMLAGAIGTTDAISSELGSFCQKSHFIAGSIYLS
jgi:hypothetical protein